MEHAHLTKPALKNAVALRELGRFFTLSVELNKPLTMFSEYIDDAWHALMNDDAQYRKFCLDAVGQYIGHKPGGSDLPESHPWVRDYEARFGRLDESWFADSNGSLNAPAFNRYLETGEVQAAWDCGPSTGSVGSV